jgi:lysophospholipase L1-like esterase
VRRRALMEFAFLAAATSAVIATAGGAWAQVPADDAAEPQIGVCAPLADGRLDTGLATSRERAEVLEALAGSRSLDCAGPLLERARERSSLDVIRLIGPSFEAWEDPSHLPALYGLYGESMLSPFGRDDDLALSTAEAIRSLRALQDQPLVQVEWPEVRARWLGLAHDRFVAEWSMGALDALPPTPDQREEYIRLADPEFLACLAEPGQAPRDPFDPLLRSSTASSELSASTRCAAQTILDTWVVHATPVWSWNVSRLLDHYPNMDYWGPLALELEQRWDQQVLPLADAPSGDRSRWTVVEERGSGIWAGLVAAVAILIFVVIWQRRRLLRRAVAFRVGALLLGPVAVVAVEGVLVLAGAAPGDELRPLHECRLEEFDGAGGAKAFLDKRNRGFTVERPDGVTRVAVVGASTVAGPGLPFEETIPGQLQALLGDRAEVVALGVYGIDSPWVRSWAVYAVDRLDADLVVVYSGHNEVGVTREQALAQGLGPPAWWLRAQGVVRRTRLAGLVMPLLGSDRGAEEGLDEDGDAVADAGDGPRLELETHHAGFEARVTAEFEVETTDMVRAVRRRGARVLLVQPSFNHHGLRASREVVSLDPALSDRGDDLATAIDRELRAGEGEAAMETARELVRIVPEHATPHLLAALAAENLGDLDAAEASIWETARINHRGSAVTPGVAAAISRIADREGVPLADAHAALHEASPGHLPGFGLYWDYVHFNAAGAAVVAAEIARVIEEEGLLD